MTTLKFMEQQPLNPKLMICPNCGEPERLGIHVAAERRLICHACGRTFAETKGTVFFGLHYPIWVITSCATLLNGDQAGEIERVASELEVQKNTNGVSQDFAIPFGQQRPAFTNP